MADFNISGQMKVKSLKAKFKEQFGSTLRVYNGVKFADEDVTIASIAKKVAKGEVAAHGRTLVGKFEESMMSEFGIKVQVASADDSKLVDDKVSLTQSGKA